MSAARTGASRGGAGKSLFEDAAPRPLADKLRPQKLSDVVGQDHLLAPDAPIGRMVAAHRLSSMILWGPPGCGKTTIARLLAETTEMHFEPLSAVFSGVADLRKIFESAAKRRVGGQGTLLFIDEIIASTARNRTASCLMSRTAQSSWSARRLKIRLSS